MVINFVNSKRLVQTIKRKIGGNFLNKIRKDYNKNLVFNTNDLEVEINDNLDKDFLKDKEIITIAPAGFRGFYTLGICSYIKHNYNTSNVIYSGASAGAWNALYMCKKKADNLFVKNILDTEFNKYKNIMEIEKVLKNKILNEFKDEDFELDKLFISVTVFKKCSLNTNIYTSFDNLEDAIDCCIASSHIPLLDGKLIYRYKGKISIDGGFALNPYLQIKKPILHIYPEMWGFYDGKHPLGHLDLKSATKSEIFTMYQDGFSHSFLNDTKLKDIFKS